MGCCAPQRRARLPQHTWSHAALAPPRSQMCSLSLGCPGWAMFLVMPFEKALRKSSWEKSKAEDKERVTLTPATYVRIWQCNIISARRSLINPLLNSGLFQSLPSSSAPSNRYFWHLQFSWYSPSIYFCLPLFLLSRPRDLAELTCQTLWGLYISLRPGCLCAIQNRGLTAAAPPSVATLPQRPAGPATCSMVGSVLLCQRCEQNRVPCENALIASLGRGSEEDILPTCDVNDTVLSV